MSLRTPTPQHKRFAGQIAWERGLKITNWPGTSSALNGLVARIQQEHQPLATAEWQVEKFQRLVRSCAEQIEDFDVAAYSEVPSNRSEANKAIFAMEKQLSTLEYRTARASSLDDFVTVEGEEQAEAKPAADLSVEDNGDEIPF